MKNIIKSTLTFLITFLLNQSYSQVSLTTTATITETFNIGTGNSASLPSGWKMSSAGNGSSANWSTSSNVTTVSQSAQNGNPTNGGRYNWGSSNDPSSRCVGFMTSGSYATPNAIFVQYQNNTGRTITGANISFDYERYRVNTGSASVTCFTSTNGSTWTARTTGNSGSFATGSSTYTFSNPLTVNKSISLNGISIANAASLYVKWVFSTSSSNSQGIGLDNVVFTPLLPTISNTGTIQPFTTIYGTPSTNQTFSISGTNLTNNIIATAPTGYEVSSDGTNFGTTATFVQSGGSVSGNLSVRLSSTAIVLGSYNNQNIVLSSTGADNLNITTTSSGNMVSKANQIITFENLPYKTTFDVDFTPKFSSTSNLPIQISSSNTSVATIVSDKIHINGIGSTTITVQQSGNDNYNPAENISKELFIENPVSRWSFDNLNFSGIGQNPVVTNSIADQGEQTENTSIGGFHSSNSTNWTTPVGNSSPKSISSDNWSLSDYFQFGVNTQFTTVIKLTFDHTSSSTGPRDFKLQWSSDGINYNDVATYSVPFNTSSNSEYTWSSTNHQSSSTLTFDLSTITQINDQQNLRFRIVNNSTSALLGGSIQPPGTSRIDNFTMFGNLDIPLPLNVISFSGKTSGSQNRLQWTLSEWGTVAIQKYIKGEWVEVGRTDNNFWFDVNPSKGLSYYRIVSNKTFSNPIYISNEMGFEISDYQFEYFDFDGKKIKNIESNKIVIQKSEFKSNKIMIID